MGKGGKREWRDGGCLPQTPVAEIRSSVGLTHLPRPRFPTSCTGGSERKSEKPCWVVQQKSGIPMVEAEKGVGEGEREVKG